jgi:hypothetical protein
MDTTESAGGADATPLGQMFEDRSDLLGGQLGVEQHRAFAFGEASLAGPTPQHAPLVVGAVPSGDGQVSSVPLPVIGAARVLATESRQVVHGGLSRRDLGVVAQAITTIEGAHTDYNTARPPGSFLLCNISKVVRAA